MWQSLDSHCPKLHSQICPSDSLHLPSTDAISQFWQQDDIVRCQWDGLPLRELWENWSNVVQPSTLRKRLGPQQSMTLAQEHAMEFWLATEKAIEDDYKPIWNWTWWVALVANSCLAIMGLGIMWIITMHTKAGRDRRRKGSVDTPFCWCNSLGFAIVFWMLVILGWTFGLWFSVGTVMTVDMCAINGPNAVPLEWMNQFLSEHPQSTPLMYYWKHILVDCPTDQPSMTSLMEEVLSEWSRIIEPTQTLASTLEALPPDDYFDVCGVSLWPLQGVAKDLLEAICKLGTALEEFDRHQSNCEGWFPLYASMMYDTVCTEGSKTMVWITLTQMVILIMAFLIWTFRVAFLPAIEDSNERILCCRQRLQCCQVRALSRRESKTDPWYLNSGNKSAESSHELT